MQSNPNKTNNLHTIPTSSTGVFVSAVFLFIPFFIFKISWGIHNQAQSLYMHILQAAVVAVICLITLTRRPTNKRQVVIIAIFLILLAIHLLQTVFLGFSLAGYSKDYFFQGIFLWAYLFAICLYASGLSVERYKRLLYFFDFFAKAAVLLALFFYLLYKITGIALLVHFYEGFGIVRLQGFFSEPSAFAPVSCWLLLSGINSRNLISIGLAIVACVLAFSPIVIISTLLAFVAYLIIFHPRVTPLVFIAGAFITAWSAALDCSLVNDGSSLIRAGCGINSVLNEDTRALFSNDRLLSSVAIIEHLLATGSWDYGLGINATSVFMPTYFDEMRDNSLPISIIAFYGAIGGIFFVASATAGLYVTWRKKNIFSIFWLSFFWCSMINSAQGFITYALLFVASIWLISYQNPKTSPIN